MIRKQFNKKVYGSGSRFKKPTNRQIWESYGLVCPPKPRYIGLKGIYWSVVSMYVRKRDYAMWGVCVNCSKPADSWRYFQAGHFIGAKKCGFGLLFDLRNINGECGGCNAFDKQKLNYERNLDIRYGEGTAQQLKERFFNSQKIGNTAKEWSSIEYDLNIRHLLGEIELLGQTVDNSWLK